MIPRVKSVQCLNDYRILLSFDSGEERVFDVTPYLKLGLFAELKDESLFAAARVEFHTVCWPNGLDLDPEILYDASVPKTIYPDSTSTSESAYVREKPS